MRRCIAGLWTLVAWITPARAESPVVGARVPRQLGRAGVGTASDDGAGALLQNPAGLARRGAIRAQLALGYTDDETSWLGGGGPAARDQSSSRLLPLAAVEGALGADLVVGVGLITTARSERLFRRPDPALPPAGYGDAFEYRYTGLSGSFRRDTLTLGVAHRLGDAIALGVAVGASRVAIGEERRLWAGDVGRMELGQPAPDRLGDPTYDVELALTASDPFAASVVAGLLVAPGDSSLELGLSVGWMEPARASGGVSAAALDGARARAELAAPRASIVVDQPLAARGGARYLGERWIAELGLDLWWFPGRAEASAWRLDGVEVIDATTVGVRRAAPLRALPSRISSRTHGAVRGALDVELIAGFLWATGGYAFTTPGTRGTRQSATFGDLGGHTLALGLEGSAGGVSISLGWARTWAVQAVETSTGWRLDNPLATGDGAVATGTFDGSTDMIGLSLDAELDAPR